MLLSLKNLTKSFQAEDVETTAVNNVSFDIAEGEFVAITGSSGSGKSTLLNLLGMLDSPDSGSYLFDGAEVANLDEDQLSAVRKENIGFIFQSFNLIDDLSVCDNVALPLIYRDNSKADARSKAEEVLKRMQMDHRLNHFPAQLSGGQQQRVAVARALVTSPKLILADEPTGNLDTKIGAEVMKIIVEMHKTGKTIVMVTHSTKHAEMASRQIELRDGEIVNDNSNLREDTPNVA